MSEDKKAFTVKDRRHFTSEGAAREEAPEAAPEAASDVHSGPRMEAKAPAGDPVASDRTLDPVAGKIDEQPLAAEEGGPRTRFPSDFPSLLVTLGTQGSMLLAGVVPGADGPGPPDLEGAKDVISLLENLQAKTRGNLGADEERLLSGILYELRMGFVALRKGPRA